MVYRQPIALIVILVLGVMVFASSAHAEDNGWQFYIAPFLWIADIDFTISTPQFTFLKKNLDFREIIENLKGVFMTGYGFEKGKFSVDGDLVYMYVEKGLVPRILPGERNTKLKAFCSQLMLGYEIFDLPAGGTMKLSYKQQLGTSYHNMRIAVDKLGGGELSDLTLRWFDFVVGGEFTLDFNEKVSLVANGNAGGFGWGSSSKLVWAFGAFFDYHLTERSTVRIGYRHLDIKKEQGPVTLNMAISGPVLEYIFRF